MIDFHTHILPGIDDGSSHVEESAAMLTALREQGADTVFLTPHFYPQESCLTDFLEKRAEAMEKLKPILTEDMPTCRLGAEVSIIYRRTEAELPARREEVAHAKEEGIEFRFLTNPAAVLGNEQGWVSGIRCQQMELG